MSTPRMFSAGTFSRDLRPARHPWPDDCFIQGGDDGLVFTEQKMEDTLSDPAKGAEAVAGVLGAPVSTPHYRTAFFEAFPRSPDTFIRGEGRTIEEAEDSAWTQFQRFSACPGHEWERRDYDNGAGFCRHCGMFGPKAFLTTTRPCVVCGDDLAANTYGDDRLGRRHCKRCYPTIPENAKSELHKMLDQMRMLREHA